MTADKTESALKTHVGEILRFVVVGIVATAIHYGVYYVLLGYMGRNVAYSIGFLVSFLCNFVMSVLFTFKVQLSLGSFVRFAGSHAINYLTQIALFNLFVLLGVPDVWTPLPVYMIAVPVNFLLVRFALVNLPSIRSRRCP